MAGLFGIKSMSEQLKEKIAADVRDVTADGSIGKRLEATGQIVNVGGPKEFASSIAEQSAKVSRWSRPSTSRPRIDAEARPLYGRGHSPPAPMKRAIPQQNRRSEHAHHHA